MRSFYCTLFCSLIAFSGLSAQTILTADGPGNTYALITSVLAPGQNPIETPDCSHTAFGPHIEEVWDTDLAQNVFLFHIHVTPDDDRCINFDRQRNEIKTYDQSPDNLKGVIGETVIYKWKFKLDAGFQASNKFTHLHQIKAVGGSEESMPQITLTARASSPDNLELRYAESNTQITLTTTPLSGLKGNWVEVEETITYGEIGTYEISITKISDGSTLLYYQDNNIRMWKTDAEFMRPKWGIYRSLLSSSQLQDEELRFADFSIEELCALDPIFTANGIPASCVNGLVDSTSAYIQLNSVLIGDRYGYSLGSTYTGPDYTAATSLSGATFPVIVVGNIPNPTFPVLYTVRVYNGGDQCFIDKLVYLFGGVFQDADSDGVCDSNDLCNGGPDPGQACDDGNAATTNDVVDSNCVCAGSGASQSCSEEIILFPGWNIIATNCRPNDLDLETIFTGIPGNVIEVKDLENSYVPLLNYNHIGDWDEMSIYRVKVLLQDTIYISGTFLP